MLWPIIFLVAASTAKCDGIIQAKTLTAFVQQFRAPQQLPIIYRTPKETKIKLIKSTSEKGLTLDWVDEFQYSKTFLLIISQDDGLFNRNKEITINQQIYFLTPSLNLYEKYTVNNQLILQKLGRFVGGMYMPEESIEQNFLKRRQNFHGSKLIALALNTGHDIKINKHENATYFPYNETYDVTDLIQGSIFDIWMIMQSNLNFTTEIYSRMNDKWGVPVQHPNGSISVSDGIIKDGMDGLADILLTRLVIMFERYLAIDFLFPLKSLPNGIFVNKDSMKESLDFKVFQKPLDKWTWTALILSSLIVAISIVLSSKVLNQGNLKFANFMDIFAKSLKANLGSASFTTPITNKFHSLQMVIFVALITGNIIWIAYNGALLSKLIKPRFEKPFHHLESLAESNYKYNNYHEVTLINQLKIHEVFCPRLNTGSRSGAFGSVFSQANPNTVYESIFENNMGDSSSYDWKESLIKTVTLPRQALFYFQENVSAFSETACKVSRCLIHLSF